jgi:Ca-activated chloride channel family protein
MKRFPILLIAAGMLLSAPGWAQAQEELPSAPAPVQPRFPGAVGPLPAQPAEEPSAPQTSPSLTTLPPAKLPAPVPSHTPAPVETQEAKATPEAPAASSAGADAVSAEQAPGDDIESLYRIGVEVDLVNLIFTATDKRGHFIKDLKQDDVRLLDDDKPPEQVVAFESETGLPLRVGLLIDASNSIRHRFRFEQNAAAEFLNQVVRPKSDQAFVIGFDTLVDLTQDFTDNAGKLSSGIGALRPGGGTALHDAVYAASEKLGKAKVRGPARRAIILLSDGDDNQSRHTREEAIAAALHSEVIIYVISTDATDSNRKGDKVLMRYAEATGGRVFFPLQIKDVADAFKEIEDELRSQYVLAYKPQNFAADGKYRSISLDVPKRSKVKIRVRKGYYAPKQKG